MMIQNLGKIFLFIFLSLNLYANNIQIKLSSSAIYKGDTVSFTIIASGNNIKFPKIDNIEGFTILGNSSSRSTSIVNGNITRNISKTYTFRPSKSVEIPSLDIEINGKIYKTKSRVIKVVKPSASKSGDSAIIELKVSKNELRVGESFELSLILKEKINSDIYKIKAYEPKLDNFWLKRVAGESNTLEGNYKVRTIKYIAFPQKAGDYKIPSLVAQVGKMQRRMPTDELFNDPFFNMMLNNVKWENIYSNELEIKVKALPNNLEVYGDYAITASVDKLRVKANEPVNLNINITGIGNIDDIKKFNLEMGNEVVYANEPKITSSLKNGEYSGSFNQKIAIIAQNSYTIPQIEFTYFDKFTNSVKTISTKAINIEVVGEKKIEKAPVLHSAEPIIKEKIKVKTIIKQEDSYIKYLSFVIGLILGFLLNESRKKLKKDKKQPNDMIKKIKKAKNHKELLQLLLPYSKKDENIKDILIKLEQNVYEKANHKIDKNKLMDSFDE